MNIAINDLSFLNGFASKKDAINALNHFCELLKFLKNEKISGVKVPMEIINSPLICSQTIVAPDCSLLDALKEIKREDRDRYLFMLGIFTKRGQPESILKSEDVFCFHGMESVHCAQYKNEFLISLQSDVDFAQSTLSGTINHIEPVEIRNIADEIHIYKYWEPLGFREYERNRKHGNRVYTRKKGMVVGTAPKTDELGQQLLNKAIAFRGKLYSVDTDSNDEIYQFPNTEKNIFHAFRRDDIAQDDRKKILEIWKEKNGYK